MLRPALIIIVILAVAAGGYYLYQNNKTSSPITNPPGNNSSGNNNTESSVEAFRPKREVSDPNIIVEDQPLGVTFTIKKVSIVDNNGGYFLANVETFEDSKLVAVSSYIESGTHENLVVGYIANAGVKSGDIIKVYFLADNGNKKLERGDTEKNEIGTEFIIQ